MRILAVFTIIANILTQEEYEHLFLLQPFSEAQQNAIPSFHSKKSHIKFHSGILPHSCIQFRLKQYRSRLCTIRTGG